MTSISELKRLSLEDLTNLTIKIYLTYNKNGNIKALCKFYGNKAYDKYYYGEFTKNVRGYGYDKQSTAVSNCLNEFRQFYKPYTTLRYNKEDMNYYKNNKRLYGLYKDYTISYGIGVNAVLNCLTGFKNIELVQRYEGINEDFYCFDIKGLYHE